MSIAKWRGGGVSFARHNGLPTPAITHQLAYREQVVRDLFDRYRLTASTADVGGSRYDPGGVAHGQHRAASWRKERPLRWPDGRAASTL